MLSGQRPGEVACHELSLQLLQSCGTQNHKPLTTRARCPRDVPCVDCAQPTGAGPEDTQSLLKAVGRDEEPSRAYPEPRGKTQSTHSLPDGVSSSQWAGGEVGRWVEPWMDRQGDGAVDGHTDCAGAERESVELRKTKSPVCLPTTHFTEEWPEHPRGRAPTTPGRTVVRLHVQCPFSDQEATCPS